jgi:hypothetical protein
VLNIKRGSIVSKLSHVGAVSLLTALNIMVLSCNLRAGDIVLIPSGYEGWVTIRYEVKESPALPKEGFKTLIQIPSSGILSTSSSRPEGYGSDTYYALSSRGTRTRIPAEPEPCSEAEECVGHFEYWTSPAMTTIFYVGASKDVTCFPQPTISTRR